jgi:hypothetical protein
MPEGRGGEGRGKGERGEPRHGKRRDDLVAYAEGAHGRAGRVDGADELVAHDEAGGGGLDAAVGVEFPAGGVRFCVCVCVWQGGRGWGWGGVWVAVFRGPRDQTRSDRTMPFEKVWKDHGGTS